MSNKKECEICRCDLELDPDHVTDDLACNRAALAIVTYERNVARAEANFIKRKTKDYLPVPVLHHDPAADEKIEEFMKSKSKKGSRKAIGRLCGETYSEVYENATIVYFCDKKDTHQGDHFDSVHDRTWER